MCDLKFYRNDYFAFSVIRLFQLLSQVKSFILFVSSSVGFKRKDENEVFTPQGTKST